MSAKKKKANRKYKDSVFRSIFNNKTSLLELYNAIKGTNYKDESIIEINTLEDVLFASRKNDISFTVKKKIVVLIEHQSTIDENIPLRILSYITRIYEKMLDEKTYWESGKIPWPEFIVLYNGKEPFPEKKYLKLSDLFEEIDVSELIDDEYLIKLDLIVPLYNINKGFNKNIKRKSGILNSYSFFVDKTREYEKKYPKEEALKLAVEDCIKNGILEDYFKKYSVEGASMASLVYNEKTIKKIGIQIGLEQGVEKGQEQVLELVKQGLSYEEIKKKLETTSKKKHKENNG